MPTAAACSVREVETSRCVGDEFAFSSDWWLNTFCQVAAGLDQHSWAVEVLRGAVPLPDC